MQRKKWEGSKLASLRHRPFFFHFLHYTNGFVSSGFNSKATATSKTTATAESKTTVAPAPNLVARKQTKRKIIMLESNIKAVNNDIKVLLKDAQALFSAAATLSGEKAEEARLRGMALLDAAMQKAQDVQTSALATGKQMAVSTDAYVKENPWSTIGVAATAGLLVGLLCCRKS